jgi:hypothetical protein
MKAHALLDRADHRYAYQLTDKGLRVALMFILFHQRVYGLVHFVHSLRVIHVVVLT